MARHGGVAAVAAAATAHAVTWGVGMFGYGGGQGLGRGLKVQCGRGSGESSGVCLYASTAGLLGQGVAGAVAEAAAIAEGKVAGAVGGNPGVTSLLLWWCDGHWCSHGKWCVHRWGSVVGSSEQGVCEGFRNSKQSSELTAEPGIVDGARAFAGHNATWCRLGWW